jgi:hypothetical protein
MQSLFMVAERNLVSMYEQFCRCLDEILRVGISTGFTIAAGERAVFRGNPALLADPAESTLSQSTAKIGRGASPWLNLHSAATRPGTGVPGNT